MKLFKKSFEKYQSQYDDLIISFQRKVNSNLNSNIKTNSKLFRNIIFAIKDYWKKKERYYKEKEVKDNQNIFNLNQRLLGILNNLENIKNSEEEYGLIDLSNDLTLLDGITKEIYKEYDEYEELERNNNLVIEGFNIIIQLNNTRDNVSKINTSNLYYKKIVDNLISKINLNIDKIMTLPNGIISSFPFVINIDRYDCNLFKERYSRGSPFAIFFYLEKKDNNLLINLAQFTTEKEHNDALKNKGNNRLLYNQLRNGVINIDNYNNKSTSYIEIKNPYETSKLELAA